MKKLKEYWGISSNFQFIVIFIVFAITGSTAAYLSKPVTNLIGITRENLSMWLYIPIRIIVIFPIYQLLLILFGFLSGEFKFFWEFEKKMLRSMGLSFLFRTKKK